MKKRIIEIIRQNRDDFWENHSKSKVEPATEEEQEAIDVGDKIMAEKIMSLFDDENATLEKMEAMCIESLSPDSFEKWEGVKKDLCLVRKELKK